MKQSLCVKLILPLPIAFLFGYNAEMKPAEGEYILLQYVRRFRQAQPRLQLPTPLSPDGSTIQAGKRKEPLTTSAGIFSFSNRSNGFMGWYANPDQWNECQQWICEFS